MVAPAVRTGLGVRDPSPAMLPAAPNLPRARGDGDPAAARARAAQAVGVITPRPGPFILKVFDGVAGAEEWTASEFDESLGAADGFAIHAVASQVTGSSVTLTTTIYGSSDRRNWFTYADAVIDGESLSGTAVNSYIGMVVFDEPPPHFLRVRIQLGGTTPVARLTLTVTGRRR
jgi:hypothetical protein